MNILQIPRRFVTSDWGGTETVVLQTSKNILQRGHHTEIFTTMALAQCAEELIDTVKITRFNYFYPYWGLKEESRRALDCKGGNLFSFSLLKALQAYPDLDLIHLHTGKRLGGIIRYVAKKRNIPYVISLHGGVLDVPGEEAKTWTNPTKGTIEWGKLLGWWTGSRRVMDDAAAIICVGKEEQKKMQEKYPHQQVFYLPNGVDAKRFSAGNKESFLQKYNIPHDHRILLTVGRIDPQKNQLFILQLLPELKKEFPGIHYVIIGHVTNDEYYATIQKTIKDAGLEQHCTVIPGISTFDDALVNAYHAAELFLLPSIHEPFGIVLLEALSSKCPVIASRVGGIPHVINHGKDGILLPPNDSKEWIAQIQSLLNNPGSSQARIESGYQNVLKNYDWSAITGQLLEIYTNVLQKNCNPIHEVHYQAKHR